MNRSVALAIILGFLLTILLGLSGGGQVVHYADSSDLLLASSSLGLAHPPGYPLYILFLHGFTRVLWFLPFAVSTGWFSPILMGIVGGLLFYVLCIFHGHKQTAFLFGLVFLWVMIPLNWVLGLVIEVMPLSMIFCLLSVIMLSKRFALGGGFFGMLAGLYHPIVFGLVGWVWLIYLVHNRRIWRHVGSRLALGIVAATLFTVAAYVILGWQSPVYSWRIPRNATELWEFWSRQVYTASGSAIESHSTDLRLASLTDAVIQWSRWWWLEQGGAFWSVFVGLGLISFFRKKMWLKLASIIPLLLLYGPVLALYLKHPTTYPLSELATWMGIALRERMFYVWLLLIIFPTSQGLLFVVQSLSLPVRRLLLIVFCGFCLSQLYVRFGIWSHGSTNAAELYAQVILQSIPEKGVLIVDSDDVFGLLYAQSIGELRQDVVIIPVGMILQPRLWQESGSILSRFGFSTDKQQFVADLVTTNLSHQRRVFLYGIDTSLLNYLGLEGNPFYGIPHGYVLEVSATPEQFVVAYDYGLSVQLASMRTEHVDNWFKGFRAGLGGIHTQQAYYLARLGFSDQAKWHIGIAGSLFYQDSSRQVASRSAEVGEQGYRLGGSYLNYTRQPATYWLTKAYESRVGGDTNQFDYYLSRALLLDPTLRNALR